MQAKKDAIVAIVGPSGTGKSVLRDLLCSTYPEFIALKQVTTRPRRDGEGEAYDFLSKEEYDILRRELTGKTAINGYVYGTRIPEGKVSGMWVAVLDKKGLVDIRSFAKINKVPVVVVGLSHQDLPGLLASVPRKGRGVNHLKREATVTDEADVLIDVTKGYANPALVALLIASHLDVPGLPRRIGCVSSG